jgi:restriction endonuclease S subunit
MGGNMWTGSIQYPELMATGRWKVELFAESLEKYSGKLSYLGVVPVRKLFVETNKTKNPQLTPNDEFSYIGMENVESGTGDLIDYRCCTGREIKSRSKVVQSENILYGRLRPNLNKVCLIKQPNKNAICSGEFLVLVPRCNKVRPRVLKELLSSQIVLGSVIKFVGGAALPRVSLADLESIMVPLPPMDRQLEFERILLEADARRAKIKRELQEMPTMLEGCLKDFLVFR